MGPDKPTRRKSLATYLAVTAIAGGLPMLPELEREKAGPQLQCLNKCDRPRTPGKLFCSAECCKEHKLKRRSK